MGRSLLISFNVSTMIDQYLLAIPIRLKPSLLTYDINSVSDYAYRDIDVNIRDIIHGISQIWSRKLYPYF